MFDEEKDRLFWQVEALRGQVREMERAHEKTGNLLFAFRISLIHSLISLGVEDNFNSLSDAELLYAFNRVILNDWRFSRCPNAQEFHCRPLALQITRDGDIVACMDCGWDIREQPLPVKIREQEEEK